MTSSDLPPIFVLSVQAPELAHWLIAQLGPGTRVGADPKRMAALRWIDLSDKLKGK